MPICGLERLRGSESRYDGKSNYLPSCAYLIMIWDVGIYNCGVQIKDLQAKLKTQKGDPVAELLRANKPSVVSHSMKCF